MSAVSRKLGQLQKSGVTPIALLCIFCFATFGLPLLSGLPSGYDMITDIKFASELKAALLAGEFFPGWANDNFGFGSIGIRFYPPLSFYLLAITEMITADWFWAIWANLLFWMCLGSVGIFIFVREWGTTGQGLIAGIAYAMVPQHLSEVFQFFLFAEFAAWGVMPFCFLFLTRICRHGRWIDVVLFAISYSALILTHIPTTVIVSLSFPVYVLAVMDRAEFLEIFKRLAVGVVLTIGATSFRWVSIISEFDWLAHNDSKYATGYFQYAMWLFPNTLTSRNQFIFVLSSWLFDIAIVMTVALIVPAAVYLVWTRREENSDIRKIVTASVCTTAFAFFLLSRPSEFVWDAIPFLQKLQFPWRWMSVLSFSAVVGFALSVPRLLRLMQGRERLVAYPALTLIVTIILFNITQIIIPSAPIPFAKFAEVERKVAEEPLFEGWWPVWAKAEAFEANRELSADGRAVETSGWNDSAKTVTIAGGEPAPLILPLFYYPHWKATVNGIPANVSLNENGVIVIPIPGDATTVRLHFEEPFRNLLMIWISLVVWIFFGLSIFAQAARQLVLKLPRPALLKQRFNY